MIDQEEIDTIKSYVDVARFMQASGVELTRNGRSYKGYCPFHEDNESPSLSVTPGKNFWQCFGCGKGGDIIEFVQLFDRVDFKAAVAKLATYLPGGGFDSKTTYIYRGHLSGTYRGQTTIKAGADHYLLL